MIFNYTASLDAADLQLLRSRWRWLLVAGVAWHLTGFFLTLCGAAAAFVPSAIQGLPDRTLLA